MNSGSKDIIEKVALVNVFLRIFLRYLLTKVCVLRYGSLECLELGITDVYSLENDIAVIY